jgi:gluconolactonase
MQDGNKRSRREFLRSAAGATFAALGGGALAQSFEFKPNQRYPDPAVQILDPGFAKYRIYSSTVEQVATGMRWAEGPAISRRRLPAVQRHPEQPDHEIQREGQQAQRLPQPSNYANGNTRDRQGRLVTCEHSVTRRITRTEKNGKITVLADSFEGKRLNAPNDIVVKSDDSIWFTDPLFGINGEWEGSARSPSRPHQRLPPRRRRQDDAVITDLVNPNGLAFSPTRRSSTWSSGRARPTAASGATTSAPTATLSNKTKLIDAADQGALDGFRVDRDGNLWCGWGSNGALKPSRPTSAAARCSSSGASPRTWMASGFQPARQGHRPHPAARALRQPVLRRPKNNRLYMTSCHSVYALYVEAHGAV